MEAKMDERNWQHIASDLPMPVSFQVLNFYVIFVENDARNQLSNTCTTCGMKFLEDAPRLKLLATSSFTTKELITTCGKEISIISEK